ncbi:MAG TPA: hypothetical protein PK691_00460 [Thermomicrobiales bacterium]|nr:hypothetical protein [Thermomicrobiales bacterium]
MDTTRPLAISWTIRIAILVMILSLGFCQDVRANQSGPGVDDRITNMQTLCRLGAGIDETTVNRTTAGRSVRVTCRGGGFDGWSCEFYPNDTICSLPGEGLVESSGHGLDSPSMQVDQAPAVVASGDSAAEEGGDVQPIEATPTIAAADPSPTVAPESTVTVEPTVSPEPVASSDASTQTDDLPEGEIMADESTPPVTDDTDTLPVLQDVEPVFDATFESAP